MIRIAVGGDVQISQKLGFVASIVQDWSPVWPSVNKFLEEYQKSVFAKKGAAFGLSKWKPVNPDSAYGKWKKKHYPAVANQTLVLTGKMKAGFTDSKASSAARIYAPKQFIYGVDESEVPYAAAHQEGRGHLPVRKPLRLTARARMGIMKIMQGFVHEVLRMEARRISGGSGGSSYLKALAGLKMKARETL